MNKCNCCGAITKNPKYCNSSCAAKVNNRLYPKRVKKSKLCSKCKKVIMSRNKYCKKCYISIFANLDSKTKGELKTPKYQVHARIREKARRKYFMSNLPKYCIICGYDKHIDICHIKSISSFSDDTPISEINDFHNLVALCKNHHWELDNGLIDKLYIKNIVKKLIAKYPRQDSNLQPKDSGL